MFANRMDRRGWLGCVGLSTFAAATARAMAWAESAADPTVRDAARGKSLIVLWLDGGPSQLETFDPHPGTIIGGPTLAIDTAAAGVRIASHFPQLAERMGDVVLLRSVVSKEAEHQRARHHLKTGHRPDVSLAHPSLGAICAAQLPDDSLEIPSYVTIGSLDRLDRGGYLGEAFDPFRMGDPGGPLPDVSPGVRRDRFDRRRKGLEVIESGLAHRSPGIAERTGQAQRIAAALSMMDSEQITAFDIRREPAAILERYGHTPFGRGCLAARRLTEVGVRCVEVTLGGWDTHTNNFESQARLAGILDQGMATLIADLAERDRLRDTLILCLGEFGRTPRINGLDGRDHWAKGFSVVLAGGGLVGGRALGKTDPEGKRDPVDPITVPDLFATILATLGIDPMHEILAPGNRPIRLSDGTPLSQLVG